MTESKKRRRVEEKEGITPSPNTIPLPAIVQRGAFLDFLGNESLSRYMQSSKFNQQVAENEMKTRLTTAEEGAMLQMQNILTLLSNNRDIGFDEFDFDNLVDQYLTQMFKFDWNRNDMWRSLLDNGSEISGNYDWIFNDLLSLDVFRNNAKISDWQSILDYYTREIYRGDIGIGRPVFMQYFFQTFLESNESQSSKLQFVLKNFNIFGIMLVYSVNKNPWNEMRELMKPLDKTEQNKVAHALEAIKQREEKIHLKIVNETDPRSSQSSSSKYSLSELWQNQNTYL